MNLLRRILARYGLRIRIVALITALSVVLVFLIGVVVLKVAEHNFIKQKIMTGDMAVSGLQSALDTFWRERDSLIQSNEDIENLNNLVVNTIRNVRLIGLVLVDKDKRVFAASKVPILGTVRDDEMIRKSFATGRMQRNIIGTKGAFGFGLYNEMEFAGPLYHGDDVVAVARFSMPMGDIRRSLEGTLDMLYLYIFLDLLLIVITGSYLLMYFVVRPIDELLRSTERIRSGDLDNPISLTSDDEIGRLAMALEALRATLVQKDRTVKKQMNSLETLNSRLTKIRDQLIHTDRLAYVGRVTAGVAHEIGNPLGAIYGYLDILKTAGDDPALLNDLVNRISSEIGRIDSIMKELLNFSRPHQDPVVSVMLPETVKSCLEVLKAQRVLDKVSVHLTFDPKTPPILAAEGQMKQVFLNLMVNAVDAMGQEGKIQAEISHSGFDNLLPYLPALGPEESLFTGEDAFMDLEKRGIVFSSRIPYTEGEHIVMVTVRDFGSGIEHKNLVNVFEPFFTTKEKSKGTGLGLAICQRIVEGVGGLLRVQSIPGKGTAVTCYFLPQLEQQSVERGKQ